jgi:hypothetical protein
MRRLSIWVAAIPISAIVFSPGAVVASDGIPDELERGLQESARLLSPLSLRWERRRSSRHSLDELLPRIGYPATSREVLEPEFVELRWNSPMFWESIDLCVIGYDSGRSPPGPVKSRLVITRSFDGNYWYEGQPPDPPGTPFGRHDGDLAVRTLEWMRSNRSDAVPIRREYLYFAGYDLPSTLDDIGADAQSLVLRCRAGAGTTGRVTSRELEGDRWKIDCTDDRGKRHSFTIDRSLGCAVVSWSRRDSGGRLLLDAQSSGFQQIAGKPLWLPKVCKVAHYTWESTAHQPEADPLLVQEYLVTSTDSADLGQTDFRLRIDIPGTHVADASLPGAEDQPDQHVHYTIPADPKQLDAGIGAARDGDRESSRPVWRLIGLNLGVVVLIVVIRLAYKRWVKAR